MNFIAVYLCSALIILVVFFKWLLILERGYPYSLVSNTVALTLINSGNALGGVVIMDDNEEFIGCYEAGL